MVSPFDGMTLTTGDGFTLLAGRVVDQAALHGLLHQLRDIGLPLVSVTQVETDDAARPPSALRHIQPQEPDMTITAPAPPPHPPYARDPTRNHARAAGIFYLLTFLSSIPALILIGPVLNDAGYVTSAGHDTRVLWGCLLDSVNALTAVGSAVARVLGGEAAERVDGPRLRHLPPDRGGRGHDRRGQPARRRHHAPGLASGADAASMTVTANALVDVRNWTFLFGPGLMPAFNALLFGTLLYRSRLVPRIIPTVGLVGAPLLFAAFVASLFGVFEQVSAVSFFLTLPIAAWELSVGLWMTFKGFRPAAVAALGVRSDAWSDA